MAVVERDVVLMGKDGGRDTIDLPITRLGNVEDTADIKETPGAGDYLPIVDSADGGQMKKTPLSAILDPLAEAKEAAEAAQRTAEAAATMKQVNEAIRAAVAGAIEEGY